MIYGGGGEEEEKIILCQYFVSIQLVTTRCPRTLKPHIAKTTIHDGKFETYLDKKKTREIILIPNLQLQLLAKGKEIIPTKPQYHIQCNKTYVNINVSVRGQVFFQSSHGDYFLIEFIICMKYVTTSKLKFNKNSLLRKYHLQFLFC